MRAPGIYLFDAEGVGRKLVLKLTRVKYCMYHHVRQMDVLDVGATPANGKLECLANVRIN
jgi:hypothetical protein